MGTECIKVPEVKTTTNKCYAGMSYNEAKKAGDSVFKEFIKTDKNSDGILSLDEITDSRDKALKTRHTIANCFLGYSALGCGVGLMLESFSKNFAALFEQNSGKPINASKKSVLIETLLVAGIGTYLKIRANKVNSETQKMIKLYCDKKDSAKTEISE